MEGLLNYGQTKYPLGTDNLGRDMLSRMIFGARNTIGLALSITILAFLLGSLTGMIAAALGGWVDQILSRIVDVLMSIPSLIFALLILSIFGTSVTLSDCYNHCYRCHPCFPAMLVPLP